MKKTSARSLRGKAKDELVTLLNENKKTLSTLNMQKHTGGAATKLGQIRLVRKNIARIYTVIHQSQKEQLRKLYFKKKHVPKDLRPKLTRAKRRELTRKQKSLRTDKDLNKLRAYPKRMFALKA